LDWTFGGRRTTGCDGSVGIAALEAMDPVGENMWSRSLTIEERLLIAMLGEYMLP
jgi:hypothetical protein